jgi:hypothetical protein
MSSPQTLASEMTLFELDESLTLLMDSATEAAMEGNGEIPGELQQALSRSFAKLTPVGPGKYGILRMPVLYRITACLGLLGSIMGGRSGIPLRKGILISISR